MLEEWMDLELSDGRPVNITRFTRWYILAEFRGSLATGKGSKRNAMNFRTSDGYHESDYMRVKPHLRQKEGPDPLAELFVDV